MAKNITMISDDDFSAEELAMLYGMDLYGNISCEEDAVEHDLETMNIW